MWKSIKSIIQPYDKFSFWIILAAIGLEIYLMATTKFPPQVPLWYSKPWSLSRLSHPFFLYLIPFSSLLIMLANNSLANMTGEVGKLIPKVISFSTLMVVVLGFISLFQILAIVR